MRKCIVRNYSTLFDYLTIKGGYLYMKKVGIISMILLVIFTLCIVFGRIIFSYIDKDTREPEPVVIWENNDSNNATANSDEIELRNQIYAEVYQEAFNEGYNTGKTDTFEALSNPNSNLYQTMYSQIYNDVYEQIKSNINAELDKKISQNSTVKTSTIQCDTCGYIFTSSSAYQNHSHGTFICSECNGHYYDSASYADHCASHTSWHCPYCKTVYNTSAEANNCIATCSVSQYCSECNEVHSPYSGHIYHTYYCVRCDNRFTDADIYMNHGCFQD